jgi:hypothetical protein
VGELDINIPTLGTKNHLIVNKIGLLLHNNEVKSRWGVNDRGSYQKQGVSKNG